MNQPAISEAIPPDNLSSDRDNRQSIEHALRAPVLAFLISAVFWLLVSSCFGLLASAQCHRPGSLTILANLPWLTFGRVFSAFQNALVYGWLSSAGIGVAIWLLSRLCNTTYRISYLLWLSAFTWNNGIGVGILSMLGGGGNSRALLDFPFSVAFILMLAFLFFGIWSVLVIWNRQSESVYVSEWYIFAALLCFAWSFTTANILLNQPLSLIGPAPGVSQAAIHAWYERSLFGLWLAPLALAAAYYVIPKALQKPIYSYKLALLGFWGWIGCVAFGGMAAFIGGPFPAWMVTVGIVANVLALAPVLAVAANFHMTTRSATEAGGPSLVLRFVAFGAMMFTFYGFCSLILFGAIYYLLPRLLNRPIIFKGIAALHFWLSVIGFALLWFDLTIGGLIQGFGLQDAKVSMDAISDLLTPFLTLQAVAALIIFAANVLFAIAVGLILLLPGRVGNRPDVPETSMERTPEVTVA